MGAKAAPARPASAGPSPAEAARPAADPEAESERPGRELLEGVRRREPRALGAFFDYFFEPLYGLAFRLVGEHGHAEDVVQEVFLRVHRAAERIDVERDPGPWLVTIAYNVCRDRWRSRAYRAERQSASFEGEPGLAERLPNPEGGPEEGAVRSERERLVQEAILGLPEDLRAVVVLHDYQGVPHDAIGEILGITHAAARKRYSRALERLGKTLKDVLR